MSLNTRVVVAGALCALWFAIACSASFAAGEYWDQTFNSSSGNARIRIESTATQVSNVFHYQYVLTLTSTGVPANKNLGTFSVGNSPNYVYTNARNTQEVTYFPTNPVWAAGQNSVLWNKAVGLPFPNTITFSFDSIHAPQVVTFTAGGGFFSTISGSTWGMSPTVIPEPASLAALGLGIAGAGGFAVRRLRRRR